MEEHLKQLKIAGLLVRKDDSDYTPIFSRFINFT